MIRRYAVVAGLATLFFGALHEAHIELTIWYTLLFAVAINMVVFGAMGFPDDRD